MFVFLSIHKLTNALVVPVSCQWLLTLEEITMSQEFLHRFLGMCAKLGFMGYWINYSIRFFVSFLYDSVSLLSLDEP